MRLEAEARTATLSVGEMASFRLGPAPRPVGPLTPGRAEAGNAWHRELKDRLEQSHGTERTRFEVSLEGVLTCGDWVLKLNGRIDQLLAQEKGFLIREVKTVRRALPIDPEELRERYPEYFHQAALYVYLAERGALEETVAELSLRSSEQMPTSQEPSSASSENSEKSEVPSSPASDHASKSAERSSTSSDLSPEASGQSVSPLKRSSETSERSPGWSGELVFVDLDEGVTQVIPLAEEEVQVRVAGQLKAIGQFLQARQQARQQRQEMALEIPFGAWREGQETAVNKLKEALHRGTLALFEAPTGFGKTAVVLHQALGALRDGLLERIVYLTGKSTGQSVVMEHLHTLVGEGGPRYLQMRSRAEHLGHDFPAWGERPSREERARRWEAAALDPVELLARGTLGLEDVRRLGEATGVEAYEISRAMLPFADVWVGDYNYVFSARHRGVFYQQPGFDPRKTLLLVDEAHNLPSRAADGLSHQLSHEPLAILASTAAFCGTGPLLRRALEDLHDHIRRITPGPVLAPPDETTLRDLLARVAELLLVEPLDYESWPAAELEYLWSLSTAHSFFTHPGIDRLLWSPREGEVRLTCLSVAAELAPILRQFGAVVLLSATLQPLDLLRRQCGLDPQEGALVNAEASWREGAYEVAVDTRVDTRMRQRERSYPTTAETIAALAENAPEPIVAFFSSYRYAREIETRLAVITPWIRLANAPRGVSLAEQEAFVENALDSADVLLLILGTGFAEGLDALGGRVSHAIVVGPALPEVNPVQEARLQARQHLGRSEAFREVYLAPAMTKVNQALGRLVRAPGQRAKVLLHGKRFAEAPYQHLLRPEYQTETHLRREDDLHAWLRETTSLQDD